MDYKEIKKGLKRKELDDINYSWGIIRSVIVGCIVGAIAQNAVVGFVVFVILAFMAARKYYEIGKDKDA